MSRWVRRCAGDDTAGEGRRGGGWGSGIEKVDFDVTLRRDGHPVFTESAEFYDAIYFTFKDYAGEAKDIADMIRAEHTRARTVLDVACGTAGTSHPGA